MPMAAALFIAALTLAYAENAVPSEDQPASILESQGTPDEQALSIEYLDNGCYIIKRQPPDGRGMIIPPQVVCPTFYSPPRARSRRAICERGFRGSHKREESGKETLDASGDTPASTVICV